jgi:serine/threonine protein kinase
VNSQTECLSVDVIAHYLQGDLSSAEAERFEEHVQECSSCLVSLACEAGKNTFFQAALSAGQYAGEVTASALEVAALAAKLKSSPTAGGNPSPETVSDGRPASEGKDAVGAVNVVELLAPAQSAQELGRLEHYRILEELGHGGMGVVFRAEDTRLGRQVAVKVMRPEFARDKDARSRFLREARSAAAVEHDHIVAIYHVGEDRETPFFVMPLLRGQSLDKRLRDEPPLTLADAIRIGRDVALGLAAAHARGLIHRDIKPANIFLVSGGVVSAEAHDTTHHSPLTTHELKILDFGLARQEEIATQLGEPLTRLGTVMGTPEYMSPEQARGDTVDFRSDLYSTGVLLYRLTAGRLPFSATTASGYAVAHATQTPRDVRELNPALSPLLAKTIMQLLEKDPARRPASAQALADILARSLQPYAAPTQPFLPVASAAPSGKYRRPLLAAAGVVIAAILVGFALWWQRDPGTWPQGNKDNPIANQPARVKELRVLHYALVKLDGQDRTQPRGALGDKSFAVTYNDAVKIEAELTAPAYAYLLAFNADGKEQLLWPVGAEQTPDENVAPPLQDKLQCPARPGKQFALDDDELGGLQVFVVVVSSEPLPYYAEWKKARGPAAWKKLPPGQGVWSSDGAGVYPVIAGQVERGSERDPPGAPPLGELCRSLQQGARVVAVEALAFPVQAKE